MRILKNRLLIFFIGIFPLIGLAQDYGDANYYLVDSLDLLQLNKSDSQLIDSCLKVYHKVKNDTSKAIVINEIIENCWDNNIWPKYNIWLKEFVKVKMSQTNSQSETIVFTNILSGTYTNLGYSANLEGNLPKAINYYKKSLKIDKTTKNMDGIALNYFNIGSIYNKLGDIPFAIANYFKSLKIYKKIKNKKGMAQAYNNIGSVHFTQNNLDLALEYFNKSLKIRKEINDYFGLAGINNNIGGVQSRKARDLLETHQIEKSDSLFNEALEYYFKGLEYSQKINNNYGISQLYNNIGVLYRNKVKIAQIENNRSKVDSLKNLEITYYYQCLELRKKINDQNGLSYIYGTIGYTKLNENKLLSAEKMGLMGLDIAQRIGVPKVIQYNAALLSEVSFKKHNYKKAFEMRNLEIKMKDSLESENNLKAIIQQQSKYEYEKIAIADSIKNAAQQKVKNAQIFVQKAQLHKERMERFVLYGGLIILIAFGGFIYNRFLITRKQKDIIKIQKEIVEEKNKEITDSIRYAKRIQSAILPPLKVVKEYLSESFIIYKPKDIVAGDFYWMEHQGGKVLFAAADCTGHGVPGAMVSVICNNGLNRSVREHSITEPGKILDKTREIVIQEFEKSEEDVKDGMDIALCSLEGYKLQYAGAHNPLWIIRNRKIFETKANKQPIGKFDNPQPYVTHSFELEKGDCLYIFSDGYVDQFGGEKGKKFKAKAFRKLLLSIQDKSMEEQKLIIDKTFEAWKGDLEQIDDVCIIGVRI